MFLWTGGAVLVIVAIALMLSSKKLDKADGKVFEKFGGTPNKPGHNGRVGFVLGLVGLAMFAVATVLTIT